MYLGDDLFSRQPICEAVLAEGSHFLFVCKPDSHLAIEEFRADELAHRDLALAHDARTAPAHDLLTAAVKAGSRIAIWLSTRI